MVADKHVRLERRRRARGRAAAAQPPGGARRLGGAVEDEARASAELDIADVVDAANTLAVFVWGPDRIKLEYVEHKPSFSLV